MSAYRYLLAAILQIVACIPLAAAEETILVVESYNVEMQWDVNYKEALQENLGKKYRLEYFQMDTKRLPKDQHAAMADKAWAMYQALHPVLVILGDDAALKFLAQRLGKTSTPVVYLGINNNPREYFDAKVSRNITGVLERPILKRNIAFASQILPKTKRALVLFDTDITSQVVLQETFSGKSKQLINGIEVELKLVADWEHWQAEVLNAGKDYDVIFIGLYQALHDAAGRSVNKADEVVRWTSAHTPVPAFGFWDWAVGPEKTIGGLVLYGKDQGKAAADIALKILSGASPSKIYPVTADRGHFLYSKKQLERYHITLPDKIAAEASYTD
jgi:ABC-type uncharacterized transport system substrate-binding protein